MEKKKILILGAGLVTRPMVHYLLDHGYPVTIATRTVSKAEALIKGREGGIAKKLNAIEEPEKLAEEIQKADIVVSLLPATHHVIVAKECIKYKKNMVTTSYVKPEMQALDKEAKENGIILLNECGVDPGIDHMSAMKTIHEVEKNGGKVVSFKSYCGGLPALKDNNNPFGYKFSWSPRGVVVAGKSDAKYMEDGKIVEIEGEKLFEHYEFINIKGLGVFEAYPNRNSLDYIPKYGLKDVKTMFRGTLRNIGHCETWRYFVKLGLLDDEKEYNFKEVTPAKLIAQLTETNDIDKLKEGVMKKLNIPNFSVFLRKLEWLGFFEDKPIELEKGTAMDMLVNLLWKHLQYEKDELDLIILQHEFIVEYKDKKEKIISTLIDEGIPGGDTAMARTVSLPAAIAVKLVAEEKIKEKGVHIPVIPQIYEPILEELKKLNIVVKERKEVIN